MDRLPTHPVEPGHLADVSAARDLSRAPAVVTTIFPAGEQLAVLGQLVVGAVEMRLWQDLTELIPLRRVVHDVATHLDRMVPRGEQISVVVSAAAGELIVDMGGPAPATSGTLEQGELDEAREAFDSVTVMPHGAELRVVMRRVWQA